MYKFEKRKGFSLVELAIVLVVIGLLMASALTIATIVESQSDIDDTDEKLDLIETALIEYYNKYRHLPCPASNQTVKSDVNFGKSQAACDEAAVDTDDVPIIEVRIGTVPVRDLSLPTTAAFDAWNNRITYAVIKGLAVDEATYAAYDDGIDNIDDDGGGDDGAPDTDGVGGADTDGIITIWDSTKQLHSDADNKVIIPFVLVSHGKDGVGSYRHNGIPNPAACSGSALVAENCDKGDALFIDEDMFDIEGEASYYDDIVRWTTKHRLEMGNASKPMTLPVCVDGETALYDAGLEDWECGSNSDYEHVYIDSTSANNSATNGSIVSPAISISSYPGAKYVLVGCYASGYEGRAGVSIQTRNSSNVGVAPYNGARGICDTTCGLSEPCTDVSQHVLFLNSDIDNIVMTRTWQTNSLSQPISFRLDFYK